MKKTTTDIESIIEYVEYKKTENDYIKKEELELIFEGVVQAFSVALDKIPDRCVDAISGCYDEKKIASIMRDVFAQTMGEAEAQSSKLNEKSWNYSEIYRAIFDGYFGRKQPPDTPDDYYFRWLVHQAKYNSEVEYREVMRHKTIDLLRSGEQLPEAARSWLAYVVEHTKGLPHESNGAPRRGRELRDRRWALARFIFEDEKTIAKSSTTERLNRAAEQLCTTFETVRNDYYQSDEFAWMLRYLKE